MVNDDKEPIYISELEEAIKNRTPEQEKELVKMYYLLYPGAPRLVTGLQERKIMDDEYYEILTLLHWHLEPEELELIRNYREHKNDLTDEEKEDRYWNS